MKTIYKYKIEHVDEPIVLLPKGAVILSVDVQHEELNLWAIVDPDEKGKEITRFALIPTGGKIFFPIERSVFLKTIQFANGHLVFHLFRIF